MSAKRIAIIGAGPIGVEAALHGLSLGHDVTVLEQASVGANLLQWGFVRLFSAWELNHSTLGAATLRRAGVPLPSSQAYLTGAEHVERYLKPLVQTAPLRGRVREGTRVVAVGRDGIGKRDLLGGPRHRHPFRLLVESEEEEEVVEADVVMDCSGTYGNHNWMGNGNLPALGERTLEGRIAYTLRDILGSERHDYTEKRTLVVGSGHSAATALDALTELPGVSVIWVAQSTRPDPLPLVPGDPLPERDRLSRKANALAAGKNPRVRYFPATRIERVQAKGEGFSVELLTGEARREPVEVDRILAHVGYSPDNRLYRELQVHECYASLGPMKLSAALLGSSSTSSDCLAQDSMGPETLRNPEPDFYILGAKSYGKNSNFLIRIGVEQVHEVYTLIEGRQPATQQVS